MTATTTSRITDTAATAQRSRDRITKSLLGYGVIAGPIYLGTALIQAATRQGFDITKHAWSQLALGDQGWIQTANFVVTGLMIIAGAVGLRRALAAGAGARWAPGLFAAFGLSLLAAAVFEVDPGGSFPVGAPALGAITSADMVHFAAGAIGFSSLFAGLLVFARRLQREQHTGWAWACRIIAPLFLAAFLGMASGTLGEAGISVFVVGMAGVLLLLSLLHAHRYRQLPDTH